MGMSQLQLKIIETFSIIDFYREELENVYNEMVDILNTDADGYEKRAEAAEFRKKTSDIREQTTKYFDCVDGIRGRLTQEMKMLTDKIERVDRAEQSVKRLRKIADRVIDVKSTTSKRDIEEIERLFRNIKDYMERHLSYVKKNT